MIISRTPFRISFVGGGTDLNSFLERGIPGQVINTTIDKYIYVCVKKLSDIHNYKYRIAWNVLEFVNTVNEIQHPVVREALKLLNITDPLEVVTYADLPSNTGLGSSSSFTVGLLNALHAYKGEKATKTQLAEEAAHIEIDILKRSIGKQDHYAAAYGNVNVLTFYPNRTVNVEPVLYKKSLKEKIERRLMMFYTAKTRDASSILEVQSKNVRDDEKKYQAMLKMKDLVPEMEKLFEEEGDINRFGELLHENWILKRNLTIGISDDEIDDQYNHAMSAGAIGGKLLGAGGGGFLLFYVEPEFQEKVRKELKELYELKCNFEDLGTHIVYYQPDF